MNISNVVLKELAALQASKYYERAVKIILSVPYNDINVSRLEGKKAT